MKSPPMTNLAPKWRAYWGASSSVATLKSESPSVCTRYSDVTSKCPHGLTCKGTAMARAGAKTRGSPRTKCNFHIRPTPAEVDDAVASARAQQEA